MFCSRCLNANVRSSNQGCTDIGIACGNTCNSKFNCFAVIVDRCYTFSITYEVLISFPSLGVSPFDANEKLQSGSLNCISRIQNIINELNGEKIDVIEWNEDPATFISAALLPAQVMAIDVKEEEKFAQVIVPDDQLSLAIGKAGQNARLAARLVKWKIDIKSESQFKELMAYEANKEETTSEEVVEEGNDE
jgi:hypothetical protein